MKILAIDIGTAHIKSVIVEARFKAFGFKGFDISLHDITSVPDAWEPVFPNERLLSPGQLSTLAEIRSRYAAGVDRIVTNLPYSLYSSRFQTFPLKDKRKVQAAVKFAIEDEIPFDLDDCVMSSQLYPTKAKETHVLTGFAPIPPLKGFLDSLQEIQLSPDCLMMDDAALAAQFLRTKGERPKNVAVLNLGHRKTGMFFFRDSLPVLHRNSMVGGYHVTAAISQRYNIGLAEAELAKTDRGFLAVAGMQLNADQQAFSETIRQALEPVFHDFQQSLMAFSSRYSEPVDAIYLCGGTSLLPGLPEFLAQRWQKRILPLQVTHLFPQISIRPQRGLEWLLPNATAIGLSQVGGEGRSQINLRSGKLYSNSRGLKLDFKQFVYPAKLALILYLVAMTSVIGQTIILRGERAKKDDQLTRAIKNVVGGGSNSFIETLKTNPDRLKAKLREKENEFQAKGAGGGSSATLDLLQDLTKGMPPSATMEVKQFELVGNKLTLKIESPSQGDAERASAALAQLPFLMGAKAGPIEPGKGNRKRFTLTATLPAKRGT
ncbi:MAG TPA: pilus assembly protein PilM [Bdellovibrionota bacterium]|jgi:Tfp pilus assembly PilM family ATPase